VSALLSLSLFASLSLCALFVCCVSGCAASVHQQLAWWSGIMASLQTGCGFNSHISHQHTHPPTHPTSYLQLLTYIHKFCSLMPTSKFLKNIFSLIPPSHTLFNNNNFCQVIHHLGLFVPWGWACLKSGEKEESWATRKDPNFYLFFKKIINSAFDQSV
jgi:hypothetical protein